MLGSSPLIALYDRMSRAIQKRRSMTMSSDDLDWFIVAGGYARLLEAVASETFEEAKKRIEDRGGDIGRLEELYDERYRLGRTRPKKDADEEVEQ